MTSRQQGIEKPGSRIVRRGVACGLASAAVFAAGGCARGISYVPQTGMAGPNAVGATSPGSVASPDKTVGSAPTTSRTAILGPGSTGDAVTVLLSRLRNIGCTLTVNGIFDPKTVAAINTFNVNKKLPATGTLAEATKAALNASIEAADVNCGLAKPTMQDYFTLPGGDLPFCGPPLAPTTPCQQRSPATASPTPSRSMTDYFKK